MKNLLILLSLVLFSGCAGSASHQVVTSNTATDNELACEELKQEIIMAQAIIDGVNKDKEDVSTTPENLEKVFSHAMRIVPSISKKDIITSFAGSRPAMEGNDFYIDISKKTKHFIQAAGIQSPGLTASPAIGDYVKDLLKKDGLSLVEKTEYDPFIKPDTRVINQTPEKMDSIIKKDKTYGNIVCR